MITLSSKLARPQPPLQLVERPHLYAHLDDWESAAAIYVHAPAGYGKSTLISRWLDVRALGSRTCWISLDGGDNDPQLFVHYLAAALERVQPGIADVVQPLLGDASSQPVLAIHALLSAVEQAKSERSVLLVLDDLHYIDSPEMDALLAALFEYRPACLHFIILSRRPSSGPLSRLYATGQVRELSAADLRFHAEEYEAYLTKRDFPPFQPHEYELLVARSEGWISALQLATVAVGQRHDFDALASAMETPRGWQGEYLASQLLAGQSSNLCAFLLETSILEEFSAESCAAVTCRSDTGMLLSQVKSAGLPIVALDNRQEWFRYHHLFRKFLQRRLHETTDSFAVAELQRRASMWLASHDEITAAVSHALSAQDYDLAAAHIADSVRPEILNGSTHQARRWLAMLPDEQLNRYPQLLLDRSLLAVLESEPELLALIEQAQLAIQRMTLANAEHARLNAELEVHTAIAHAMRGDTQSARDHAALATDDLDALDDMGRGMLAFVTMHLRWMSGSGERAFQEGFAAIDAFRRAGFHHGILSVRREQAYMAATFGRAEEALTLLQAIFDETAADTPFAARELLSAYLTSSTIRYWLNQTDRAYADQQMAVALARRLVDPDLEAVIESLSPLYRLEHVKVSAKSAPGKRPPATSAQGNYPLLNRMNVYQLVCMGHVEQAWHTASLLGIHLDSKPDERTIAQILIFLRATIARGIELDAAETLMIATAETAAGIGSKLMAVEARALAAWRYLRMNQPAEAENELAAALDIASKTGYVRHILDIPDLAPLLATMQHPAAERCWIATIPESQRHSAARLTNQERRVLSQLASRLRYQDIADAQDITINTVRTHVRHIYAKLGVNSRQDAIARARIMGFEQNE